jgi:hypothetical protein
MGNRVSEVTIYLAGEDERNLLPSDLLGDDNWKNRICELFGVDHLVPSLFVDVEMKEKGDLLVKMSRGRMKCFLKNRIQSEAKRSHRALTLAHKNLSVVAANMVLADHVKKNLNCLDGNHSLLTNASNKFLLCQTFPENEGDYLYFDMNLGEFVRSGKVTGRGFLKLHAEHETQPKKEPASSNFYFQCPSKAVSHSRSHQGEFEALQQYIAAGFNAKSNVASAVDKPLYDGGILILDMNDSTQIKESMEKVPNRLHVTQISNTPSISDGVCL